MNNGEENEYRCTNRQSTRRRDFVMNNIVHDREYTFADQYYEELQAEFYSDLLKDLSSEED
jgi:hypothetical protein